MNAAEFTESSIALLRTALGWQSAIAKRLGVNRRTVVRWLADDATPPWVEEKFAELMGGTGPQPWPRDEWLIGDAVTADGRPREYIAHLAPPRFVARIVGCGSSGRPLRSEQPADVVSGVVYVAEGGGARETVFCEIDWIDAAPAGQIAQLMEAAADAFETYNARVLDAGYDPDAEINQDGADEYGDDEDD